jgi:pectate lyase/pectin methylesterase-like acyl-CoA thioesterase
MMPVFQPGSSDVQLRRRIGPVLTRLLAASGLWLAGCGSPSPDPQRLIPPAVHGLALFSAADRPRLDAGAASRLTAADYLARGPTPWQPESFDASRLKPDFTVAPDGSGSHRTVQAALDAVPARAASGDGARRWVVQVRPGTYRGPLCVRDKAPLVLMGVPGDRTAVTLVDGRYNGLPKRAGIDAAQPCHPNRAAASHGTSGSATAIIDSPDVLLAHLRIANDATEPRAGSPAPPGLAQGAQAVALLTRADRVQLEDVELRSHQDTFYVRRPEAGAAARVFVRGSLIAGDVDFVFGNATLVIDDSTLLSRADRRSSGHVLAPSTAAAEPLGFLVQRSRFVAEPGLAPASVSLGRAWDEGVSPGQWQAGSSPNGHALVRDSLLGPHIGAWAASTARRSFRAPGLPGDAHANRLAEFNNGALPGHIAREVLPVGDGWGAAAGGVRGGADAMPRDVHAVRTRRELAVALQPHAGGQVRPRIVQVLGRIDLSQDDAGRLLRADDFRDPAFSWPAFAAAYDPASWGRRPPEGPLEEARRRSAAAQAARVVLRLPSRTTLIGIGDDAQIVGNLLIDGAQDVIVRNLRLSSASDHFPAWDPQDNGHGEWNADYDALTLRGAEGVWVDHCTLDSGDPSDPAAPVWLGRPLQRSDGLLDIIRRSTHVTVSWNHLRHHDKTTLVGNSDKRAEDEGRLKVSFHHNWWEDTRERSPRVRYGRVHVFNNFYLVRHAERFGYSLGVGYRSAILSQHNAWESPPGFSVQRLLRRLGGGRFTDEGSLLNGLPAELMAAWRGMVTTSSADAAWVQGLVAPPVASGIDPAAEVPARVRAGAGAGRLWTGPPLPGGS